jgi:SAM-dependent methyltransferase
MNTLTKLHWFLSTQLGFDLRRLLRSLRGIPSFVADWWRFRKGYAGTLTWLPCLHDRYEEGGTTKSEYFWQDLLVARWIFAARPERHVDVGSRVDGFVAHVASFRDIELFDVRPISTQIPGVVFKQADLMRGDSLPDSGRGYCDSLSCLHAIEHFGLGRYGDPIDPAGHERGIANMASLLQPGGTFYLSTPIGRDRVEFNANRVFDPASIIRLVESHGLALHQLTVIGRGGVVQEMQATPETLQSLAAAPYNLGIFVFTKTQPRSVGS